MEAKTKKIMTAVDELSDEELHTMCNEIFAWKNDTGTLPANSHLKNFSKAAGIDIQTSQERVLNEASYRFQKMIILLMSERPYRFLNYRVSLQSEN